MQQSGTCTEVRILTENVYKFRVLGGSKLIREFCDKGCNVKSLNKLLKKVRHSGSMRRQTRSGRRRCAFWRVASFYKVQYEHIKRDMNWACTCVCFTLPGACFCQKLAESDEIWQRYHKNKKGDVLFWDTVYFSFLSSRILQSSQGAWKSAVSSLSGVRAEPRPHSHFYAFWAHKTHPVATF